MDSSKSLDTIKGVGPSVAQKLKILGIQNVDDLINFLPRRYEDYSNVAKINTIKPGPVSVQAKVKQITGRYVRRGMHITEAVVEDRTGSLRLVWFNQPYREKATKIGVDYFISGQFQLSRNRFCVMNPAMELVSDLPVNAARIIPVYKETRGLKSNTIRKIISNLHGQLLSLSESLPQSVIDEANLISKSQSMISMHFPEKNSELETARRRLGFEEVFELSLASVLNKIEYSKDKSHNINFNEDLAKRFVKSLPFELTTSQRKIGWQILQDMQKEMPMNRLVEGDVGSGKTVLAALAAIMTINDSYQVALMAPTEILARQHAENIYKMLEPLGMQSEVILLTGSLKTKQKKEAHEAISKGRARFIIGTHALITEKVDMHNLGLVVIDEQHRFGVDQRKKIQQKANGRMPHVLSMTATPIPRSLALTLYGELDISVLKEKPKNRLPIITKIVSSSSKAALYKEVDVELESGRQMFVVCPLISESDKLSALSAEKVYEDFATKIFKHRKVGLLHGKMKSDEKECVMQDFLNKKLDILVSTTVIEVGVDVPNATIMMIEGVERFGLAQAHQLRGRVGRGKDQGYCYLIMSDSQEPSKRIKALESSNDGFKLSELDLEIRGPGAIYGQSQSGDLDLRVAKLTDVELIELARSQAIKFVASGQILDKYPELKRKVSKYRSITNLN